MSENVPQGREVNEYWWVLSIYQSIYLTIFFFSLSHCTSNSPFSMIYGPTFTTIQPPHPRAATQSGTRCNTAFLPLLTNTTHTRVPHTHILSPRVYIYIYIHIRTPQRESTLRRYRGVVRDPKRHRAFGSGDSPTQPTPVIYVELADDYIAVSVPRYSVQSSQYNSTYLLISFSSRDLPYRLSLIHLFISIFMPAFVGEGTRPLCLIFVFSLSTSESIG